MIESEFGEDTTALCPRCGYAANLEVATAQIPKIGRMERSEPLKEIHTPNVKTIDQLDRSIPIRKITCVQA